jgi:23S rRNA (cytosine1962-C5)-methyltransferase
MNNKRPTKTDVTIKPFKQNPAPVNNSGMRTLIVSRTTARFIGEGHPWVRPDRFTRGLELLHVGEPVTLIDDQGKRLASALADPTDEICARVYHRRPDMPFIPEQALSKAWEKRAVLHDDPQTNCYRVVHGENDFLPGIRIERYGDVFVVVIFARCAEPYGDVLCVSLQRRFPNATIVRRLHVDDLRRSDVHTRIHGGGDIDAEKIINARELGVTYPLRPFAGLATGIYVDQRATRSWLMPQAAGKRVLNLFAYTGAFSIALLHAGATHATDVDLAAPALARATEAAVLNNFAERHTSVHSDCRRFLLSSNDTYDIIICDPPTAAQGADGWILRRDYPAVLSAAFARLAPGGLLLACCNTLGGKPFPLSEQVQFAAREAQVAITLRDAPALGIDLPHNPGFPEGRPYRLVVAVRNG